MRPAALALTLALALACAACRPPRPPSSPAHAAPPSAAAVVVHTADGAQLSIADFETGRLTPVGPPGGATQHPVWSPDGTRLAYRVADQLFVRLAGSSTGAGSTTDLSITAGVNVDAAHPYVFSPDGTQLAVALRGSVIAIAADGRGRPRVLGSYPDQRVADLAWPGKGDAIFALVAAPPPSSTASIAVISTTGQPTGEPGLTRSTDGVSRFLGWRPQDQELLALQSIGGAQAIIRLHVSEHKPPLPIGVPAGYRVLDYLAATNELVLTRDDEDSGPVALYRAPALRTAPPQRWLATYPALNDLQLSADGAWATFIDRVTAPPGTPTGALAGSVVRVPITAPPAAAAAAQVALEATPARAFSGAVPRPSGGGAR